MDGKHHQNRDHLPYYCITDIKEISMATVPSIFQYIPSVCFPLIRRCPIKFPIHQQWNHAIPMFFPCKLMVGIPAHENCMVQPWRCSAPELRKGCVFLKCHVGGLSICRCTCDPWQSLSSSSSSSSSSLMKISWCYYSTRFSIYATGNGNLFDLSWRYVADAVFRIGLFVKGGGRFFGPLWRYWCNSPFNIFVRGVEDVDILWG